MQSATKKLIRKSFLFLIAASLCTACGYLTYNFHPIKDGHVYRSAQMNDDALEETIKRYEIRTIINLRGENKGERWYENELYICEKHDVAHYDISFSAQSLPKKKELLKFFETLDTAEYPLLIHCQAGSDRTGLASVIYELQYEGKTLNESLEQLSFFSYGHFGPTAIDDFFGLYEKFGGNRDLHTWVLEDYDEMKYEDYLEAN